MSWWQSAETRCPRGNAVRSGFSGALRGVANHIAGLVRTGGRHHPRDGPQVGHILRRGELVEPVAEREGLPELPLWLAVAASQGEIGHLLSVAVDNALKDSGLPTRTVTVVTHAVVDADDPAFDNPQKPIGSLLDAETARLHEDEGWHMVRVTGGYRRVVPSPKPRWVLDGGLQHALNADTVLIAGAAVESPSSTTEGGWHPIDAVIDKGPRPRSSLPPWGSARWCWSRASPRFRSGSGRPPSAHSTW